MKIYVSEKEKDFIDACLSESGCYSFVENTTDYEDWLLLYSLEQHEEEIKKQLLDKHYYEIKHKIIKELGSDLIRHIEENGYDDNTIQDFLKERGVE